MDLFSLIKYVYGKTILYILIGIRLPSLPVSILYFHVFVLYVPFVFCFEIIGNFTL